MGASKNFFKNYVCHHHCLIKRVLETLMWGALRLRTLQEGPFPRFVRVWLTPVCTQSGEPHVAPRW